jgi:hypothetical protein
MAAGREAIERLARLPDGPPVVTAYLDATWRDEQQRERVRLFVRERVREARAAFAGHPGAQGLERTLADVEAFVAELVQQAVMPDGRGVILVASAGRGLFEVMNLDAELRQAFYVDAKPRLGELIEAYALQRPAIIACVETGHVELLEMAAGFVQEEHSIERDVPKRHAQGGWEQRKLQRYVKDHIRMVWQEGARRLEELARQGDARSIVLFGQETNVRGFERELPPWLLARVAGHRPWVRERRAVLQAAREVLDDERARNEFAAVHRILRQGLSDRTGTVGLSDTLMAVDEQRVRLLALSRRFDAMGYQCRRCDALWETGATGCVFCGGECDLVNLREELTRRALAQGAELVVTPDASALDAYRGIGALLRHLSGDEHSRRPAPAAVDTQPS